MTFSTEQILLIISALGVLMVNVITAWRTNAKVALVHEKTAEMSKKTDENTEVTKATKDTVDRVESQTNGHLSIMTVNVQNLEAKLEMALKQNGELQGTNASIVEMMKSLLEAEANDKKELVQAIVKNGTSGDGHADAKLDTIQETTKEILLQQNIAKKLADGGQLDEMQETGDESHAMLKDQAKAAKKKE